jgi:hypothetical protein
MVQGQTARQASDGLSGFIFYWAAPELVERVGGSPAHAFNYLMNNR